MTPVRLETGTSGFHVKHSYVRSYVAHKRNGNAYSNP